MQFFELADLLIANGAHANQEIGRGDQYKKTSSFILSRHSSGAPGKSPAPVTHEEEEEALPHKRGISAHTSGVPPPDWWTASG